MSGKNLTFKLVMEGDNKSLVASAKQSEQVVSKVFETIKQEAEQVRSATSNATQGVDQFGKESIAVAAEVKKLDAELTQTNTGLSKTDAVAGQATSGIHGLKTSYTALTTAMAALGIGVTIGSLQQYVDQYKNLTASIQIAIGEHGNIEKAMDDVIAVSLKTNANLEATSGLFGRLTKIGREMKWPQEQALALTEAINKAVAVGGGSAQANEAALTQLNQALGSGVLRGDEFNSIMEQSPRLAQAMADGLKVNTGELRNMAGEGKLTADVVTKAILSQSDAITKEFAKFPTTIGNSIENLKTSWMVYLGELDKTHGVSERAANAIKYLAENLDKVMGMLTLAGQAFIAYKALNIASVFLDKAAGVRAASLALTQETAVVVANTQAQLANATATRGAAVAKTQLATNAGIASKATIATSGSIMTLVGRLGALGIAVTALGILVPTVLEPLGTAIGEGVAKLAGHGEAIEKYERQIANEAAQVKAAAEVKASFAKAAQDATEKTYQLNKESKELVASFDTLIKKGEATTEALDKISKGMSFDSTKGINDALTTFVLLGQQSKITSDEIQANLAKALDGKDLIVFETNAKAAFAGTSKEVEKLALITEAVLNQALLRTGLTFEQLQGKGSLASTALINDSIKLIESLDGLKQKGVDVGIALNASISKAISGAETTNQLEVLKSKITELRAELGVTVTNGLLQQAEQQLLKVQGLADGAKAGINSISEAFNKFGIQTKEDATLAANGWVEAYEQIQKSGTATAGQMRQALQKMTADIYASGDAGRIAWLENQMYLQDMTTKIDEFGQASSAFNNAETSIKKIGQTAKDTTNQLNQMSNSSESTSKPLEDDYWTAFKAKQKAKTDERNRIANSAKSVNPSSTNVASEINNPVVAELAPLITTAFSTQATENIQPKETKRLELAIGDQTAELEGTPQNIDVVDQLFAQLESGRKRK